MVKLTQTPGMSQMSWPKDSEGGKRQASTDLKGVQTDQLLENTAQMASLFLQSFQE